MQDEPQAPPPDRNEAPAGATRGHDPAAATPDAARPLKPFFVLWVGQALSLIGSQAVQFALIWWLTKETGSAVVLATASLVGLLPQVVLGPFAGALVDRWNRKRIMLIADASVAAASAVLAYLFWIGAAGIPAAFTLLFIRALGAAFHQPAMMASTSLMVPEEHLTRIQGLNQSLQGGLIIIAAPLGAGLFALLPMAGVMLVDVASALPALVPLLFIHVPQPRRSDATPRAAAGSRLLGEIVDGFAYIWVRPGHLAIVIMSALINLFLVPAFSLLPLFVLENLGGTAADLAWINMAFGIGSIAGGLALGVWGGFKRRILTSMTGLIGLGLAVLLLGLTPAARIATGAGAMFLVGAMVPMVNGPIHAVLQATIAPEYQGRVFTLIMSLATAAAPIGLLLAAPVAEALGVRTWYLAGAAVSALMGVAGLMLPVVARIEEASGAGQTAKAAASSPPDR